MADTSGVHMDMWRRVVVEVELDDQTVEADDSGHTPEPTVGLRRYSRPKAAFAQRPKKWRGPYVRKPRGGASADAEPGVERRPVATMRGRGTPATTERRAWRAARAASRRDDPVCARPSSPTTACAACTAGSRRDAPWVSVACDLPYAHDSRQLSVERVVRCADPWSCAHYPLSIDSVRRALAGLRSLVRPVNSRRRLSASDRPAPCGDSTAR